MRILYPFILEILFPKSARMLFTPQTNNLPILNKILKFPFCPSVGYMLNFVLEEDSVLLKSTGFFWLRKVKSVTNCFA